MKKIIFCVLGLIYVIITILITIFLLSYNDYNLAEIGNNTYFVAKNNGENYNKGDLLLINNTNSLNVTKGKKIFYYNAYKAPIRVDINEIVEVEKVNENETTYLLDNDAYISSEYVIGDTENVKIYPLFGYVLGALESTWGYLVFIVLPLLVGFVWEVYSIIKEIKKK